MREEPDGQMPRSPEKAKRFEDRYNLDYSGTLGATASRSAGATLLSEGVVFVFRVGGVFVLARMLVSDDFGLVAMVTAVYTLLQNFGENGFAEYNIQKDRVSLDETNAIFWLHALISIVLAALLMLSSTLISRFFREPELTKIVVAMAPGIILQMLSTHHGSLLKRNMRFATVGVVRVIAVAASTGLAIGLAVAGAGYWSIVARQLGETAFTAAGFWIVCRWRPSLPAELQKAAGALRYAIRVYGNYTLNYLERSLDKVLLGRFHGSAELGYYDRAFNLAARPLAQTTVPLHQVGMATLSRLRDEPATYISYYRRAVRLLGLVAFGLVVILTLSGQDLVLLLLGPGWHEAGRILVAFGPGIGAQIVYSTNGWLHLSLGLPQRWLRWNAVAVVVKLVAIGTAAPHGGFAVAAAISASSYLLLVPALWYGGKPIGLRVREIVADLWRSIASALITLGGWALLLAQVPRLADIVASLLLPVRLLAVAFGSVAAYFLLIVLLHWSFEPLRSLVRNSRMLFARRARKRDPDQE
jgi:polysaccharide transporter, PST family